MKSVMLLASLGTRAFKPALIIFCSAVWSSYISAIELEPLPVFDCVIEPSQITDLGSAVPGVISKIYARRSDSIAKGEVVAALDSSVASANAVLSKARAELTTSISLREQSADFGGRTSERNHALYQKEAISKQEIDKLDTENRIAQLQVRQEVDNKVIAALTYERAKAVLDRHLIRSPIDGVVMEDFKSVGEYIESDPVMRIAQIDPLHVEVILPVKYIGRLAPGRRAEVTPAVPSYIPRVATVTRVDKVADAASGTFGARLMLPNPDHSVAGGLRCNLSFLPVEDSAPERSRLVMDGVEGEHEVHQRSAEVTVEPAIELVGARHCYRVGPLTNEIVATSLSDTIAKLDRGSESRPDVTYSEKAGYRVFISFQQDLGAGVDIDSYFREKGLDDFYRISSAEDEVRISVGFFGNELNAKARQESLIEMGFEAQLAEVLRRSSWINLAFDSGQASQLELASLVEKVAPATSVTLTQCSQEQKNNSHVSSR